MEKKTIIHVGLHKTASTFLQETIFPKVKTYTYLTRPYTQHNFAFNKLQYADDSLYDSSEIFEELKKIDSKRLLISDESFSGKPVAFGCINRSYIASRLARIFPDAEIVLFLRGQQNILLSHYNMWIKGYDAGYRNIDDFIWFPKKDYSYKEYIEKENSSLDTLFWNTNKFYLNIECFKYYELVSLYKRLFKNVHIFLYEDIVNSPSDIIVRMESILGEKLNITKENLTKRVNSSLAERELINKIKLNKIRVLTKNKWLAKILYFYLKKRNKNFISPQEYIEKVTDNVYCENNKNLIEQYPEIGIQNYTDEYKTIANILYK